MKRASIIKELTSVGINLSIMESLVKYINLSFSNKSDIQNADIENLSSLLHRIIQNTIEKQSELEKLFNI